MNNTLIVNINSIYKNILNLRKLNKEIIFVVKGNIYGFGYSLIKHIDNHVDSYAVSSINEAKELRKYTIKNILILSPVKYEYITDDDYIIYTISSITQLKYYILNHISNINIAIKINTGLNRFGVDVLEIEEMFNLLDNSSFKVKDIYTHLATTTSINNFDDINLSLNSFLNSLSKLKNYIDISNINIHFTDSAALLRLNVLDTSITSVRTGMFLLGLDPISEIKDKKYTLHFPLKLETIVLDKHKIKKGMYYGYNKKSLLDMYICTIGIGYCDGMKKSWIEKNIIKSDFGNLKLLDVSMNTSIVEISEEIYSNISLLETKYTIFSNQEELDYLASLANTSIEDILCGFNSLNNDIVYKELINGN